MKLKYPIFILSVLFCSLGVSSSEAKTFYVRTDGGSLGQCNGSVDKAYPGSGSGLDCALEHPFWALPVKGNATLFRGGDTLIIHPGEYRMGFDAPNQRNEASCHMDYLWDCHMDSIPSGPDAENPTRILGAGWDGECSNPPKLYGVERVSLVVNLRNSSNVELQCLELMDKSPCTAGEVPGACNVTEYPHGDHAEIGIVASDSENVLLKNINVHGFRSYGIHAGRLKNWRVLDSDISYNSLGGWNGDIGAFESSNTGSMVFKNTRIQYNGCGQTYPEGKPINCFGQDVGGYGDGLGTHETGGDWIFENVEFSHNTSDGLDLLYHNGDGRVTIRHSHFEGNSGNQVKTATQTYIENSLMLGNCAYFKNKDFDFHVGHCRAYGNTLSFDFRKDMRVFLYNNTITGEGDSLIETGGDDCIGDEKIVAINNIFLGGKEFWSEDGDRVALFYAAGATGNGDGPCGTVSLDNSNALVYHNKIPEGYCQTPGVQCKNPKFEEILEGGIFNAHLKKGSPAINAGIPISGVQRWDFEGNPRDDQWDIGALEYQP